MVEYENNIDPEVKKQDLSIWNNGTDNFIEENNFNPEIKTNHTPGTELTVYSISDRCTKSFWFSDDKGNWIQYGNNES